MVYCPFCGSENLPQARFCQACGKFIEHFVVYTKRLAPPGAPEAVEVAGEERPRRGGEATVEVRDEAEDEHEGEDQDEAEDEDARDEEHEYALEDAHAHEGEAGDGDEHAAEASSDSDLELEHADSALGSEWVPEEGFLEGIAASRRRRIGLAVGLVVLAVAVPSVWMTARRRPASPAPAVAAPAVRAAVPDLAMPVVAVPAAPADAAPAAEVAVAEVAPPSPPSEPAPHASDAPADRKRARAHTDEDAPVAAIGSRAPVREVREAPEPGAPKPVSRAGAGAAVRSVARQHDDETYDCFVSAFPDARPGTRARVSVRFALGSEGHANEIAVTSNSSHNDDFASCLVSRVSGWSFPPSASGDVTVTHTFSLVAR